MATILETINQVLNYENEPQRRRELLKNSFELTEEQVNALMQAIESIPEDYTQLVSVVEGLVASYGALENTVEDLSGDVDDLKADLTDMDGKIAASLITNTASGAIASFSDGADGVPVEDLVIDIEPVQSGSGDPSPDNVRPISGWTGANVVRTGKNLLDFDTWNFSYDTMWKGGATWNDENPTGSFVLKAGTYTIASDTNLTQITVANSNGRVGNIFNASSLTFTLNKDEAVAVRLYKVDAGTSPKSLFATYNIRMCVGSTATPYEPYTGNTYSVDWTDEAGTVYGGTLDVTTGVLTATWGNIASYDGETLPGEWISDRDVYAEGTTPTTGAQVVYELATHVTYQFTPQEVTTLLGQNNIWADTGDTTVDYRANTKLYIENLTAPTEDDMVANTNIPNNTYFMVGNTLYLSTTTIPAGDTINPGTNCTLMSLASALNALNA